MIRSKCVLGLLITCLLNSAKYSKKTLIDKKKRFPLEANFFKGIRYLESGMRFLLSSGFDSPVWRRKFKSNNNNLTLNLQRSWGACIQYQIQQVQWKTAKTIFSEGSKADFCDAAKKQGGKNHHRRYFENRHHLCSFFICFHVLIKRKERIEGVIKRSNDNETKFKKCRAETIERVLTGQGVDFLKIHIETDKEY